MVIIELIGVIAVSAMLFAIVIALVAAVYHLEGAWRDEAAGRRELQRLADYFRRDAHRAVDVEVAEDRRSWSFMRAGGGRVDYDLVAGAVRRSVKGEDDFRKRNGAGKEQQLSVPAGAGVRLQESALAQRHLVTLIVEAETAAAASRETVLRVDADLGRATSGPANDTGSEGSN